MQLRFIQIVLWLAAIGLLLLGASRAIAAIAATAPAAPVPPWMWGIVTGAVVLLLGVIGWWASRWIARREAKEDLILANIQSLRLEVSGVRGEQAVIRERIEGLPCREDRGRGNGIPPAPSALCILRDRDADT